MKKTNILILVISLFALICPSINYAQCVQCDNITYPMAITHFLEDIVLPLLVYYHFLLVIRHRPWGITHLPLGHHLWHSIRDQFH
jgi:hypothetical protein